jgi:hypothetical protein
MPNHVYNSIEVETDDKNIIDLLYKIKETGICNYFKPRPKKLGLYSAPVKIVEPSEYLMAVENSILYPKEYSSLPMTQKIYDELMLKHGTTNWYDWSIENWGTKWGAYDTHFEENGCYSFSSAWSPPNIEIIYKLAKLIPNFTYNWVEEQGFGAEYTFEHGELVHEWSFDMPEFIEAEEDLFKDEEVTILSEDYKNLEGQFKAGYYHCYDLNEFLGETAEEAHKCLTSET